MKRAQLAGIAVTLGAIAVGIALGARGVGPSRAALVPALVLAPSAPLLVPRAAAPIVIDGHVDEPGWTRRSARTQAFLGADGQPGRPYADLRLTWDETTLYVAFYAGDHDVRAAAAAHDGLQWLGGDEVRLVIVGDDGPRLIEVSPTCTVTDARGLEPRWDYTWESGARAACDVDGTVNDPKDDDEEWVVELAIPLASLGVRGRTLALGARRCDTARDGTRVCSSWHDGAPAPLLLDDPR